MSNFYIRNEAAFLYHGAQLCREVKSGSDGAWQIAPFQCSIPHTTDAIGNLERLKSVLKREFPSLIEFGEKRARKAYQTQKDTITKPSYIARLNSYCDTGLDQISNIVDIATKERCSGGLVFSVFSPNDLIDRKRPGYVPCLISGSFIEHEGELQLNAFFRSQSIVEFGLFDLEFLRKLQASTVSQINSIGERQLSIGSLNVHCSRIIIQRRLMRNKDGFLKRQEVIDKWIATLEEFMLNL